MNKLRSFPVVAALAAVWVIATASLASADNSSTTEEIQNEISETSQALKGYAQKQKDKAMATAKSTLDTLDERIAELRTTLDREWDTMSATARKEARETQNALREKRQDVAEWYGAMKHSSTDAWTDVRDGFIEAYASLGDTLSKAMDKFGSGKTSKN